MPRHLLLLAVLALAAAAPAQAGWFSGFGSNSHCKAVLKEYYEGNKLEAHPYTVDNLLFHLHVPRTAGRSFDFCLLNAATPPSKQCPDAYAYELFQPGKLPTCHLLSSHDDFSIVQGLPANTSVITLMRDPVDRFLSAYEFGVELGARRTKPMVLPPNSMGRVTTDRIWPWSHLINFFGNDTVPKFKKASAEVIKKPGVWIEQVDEEDYIFYWNKVTEESKWLLTDEEMKHMRPLLDPYDNHLAFPLEDFVHHPIATDLLHNGQLMQVLGITNSSKWAKAADLRNCMLKDAKLAEELLQFAMKRLEHFAYVGVMDNVDEAVETGAAALNISLDDVAYKPRHKPLDLQDDAPAEDAATTAKKAAARAAKHVAPPKPGSSEKLPTSKAADGPQRKLQEAAAGLAVPDGDSKTGDNGTDIPAGRSVGSFFKTCTQMLQAKNKARKDRSFANLILPDDREFTFVSRERPEIHEEIIADIKKRNALDIRLYEHARKLYKAKRKALRKAGKLQKLADAPDKPRETGAGGAKADGKTEEL